MRVLLDDLQQGPNIMNSLKTSLTNIPQTSVSKASSDPLKFPSEKSLA